MRTLPKIWLMRQAGRYLAEYRAIRNSMPSFLELCYNSEKAAEVTMQPVKRFDIDAAIIFADILLVLDMIGLKVNFIENQGPVIEKIDEDNLKRLRVQQECFQMNAIIGTIKIVKDAIGKKKKVIGFAGSPWTVATYAMEGKSKTDFSFSKQSAISGWKALDLLIHLITEQTILYLSAQIEAGADIIKLFDSWSGLLHGWEYHKYVIEPTIKIVDHLKEKYPHIPIIAFPKGSGYYYEDYLKFINFDVLAVDSSIPNICMRNWQRSKIVQGNLDPLVLLCKDQGIIKDKIDNIFKDINRNKFIFNLGHGILPTTPVENVHFMVEYVKEKFIV